ncbi:putative tRNA pseudouridine synthase 2 [Bagarius yarrelli]|uniref:Putative tRNA pseudouridine synthase 2 n=1 Tax=Bagarius yarrelli TaxID=175774 RepID=A0A556VY21_BAGYA|nr:putative tRNA pseudouridine synthase 2 [Bagarius yarrelli]
MSGRTTRKPQKFGSSRRFKNRNRETEGRENDEGFQDPENEQYQNEKSQFPTASENESYNELLLPRSDQLDIADTKPNTSVPELSSQPQSQVFTDLSGQAEVTSKHRKMGSTRKGKRNFKFEGIYEDEPEDQVQLCEGFEQGLSENASVKGDEGQKFHKSLLACAPSQSKHGNATIVQNEDLHNNDENQHLEPALKNRHIDSSSFELNISDEKSGVTQPGSNVTLEESLKIYQTDTFSKPVASLQNIPGQASQIDTTYTPFNENSEKRQAVQMSQNNLIHNDKPSMAEHTVLKVMDTQSSLNVIVKDKQEDTKVLDSLSTKQIRQDEVTEVLSASLINEHVQGTKDSEVASVIWENVGTKANTKYDHSIEHMDEELTVQLTEDNIYTYEEEDNDKRKKFCVAVDRTDNDLAEVTATNLNLPIESDTNIISPLKLEEETSEQVISNELKFQDDSEINCYRKEKNYLPEAICLTGKGTADEEIFQKDVVMHYDEGKKCRVIETENEVENNDMQSENFIAESQLIPDETLHKETEAKTETCNLQQFPTELEAEDQMLDKAIKGTSESPDIETEVIKEKNDIKEDINAGSTESFTIGDFIDVDDNKAGMSTFIDELEMASNTQDYACTVQASIVVNDHYIDSPTSASIVHAYPTSDLVEQIPETQDMQVYCPITIPDQEQTTADGSLNIMEPEAKKNEENVSKALVTNDNISTSQGQHETAWYNSTELVKKNQECRVLGRQIEETLLVENIGAVLNTTDVAFSDVAAHLVDTENLKMQGETKLSDSAVRNEDQNIYSDLNLEHTKSLEFSCTINSDHPITSAENLTDSELSNQKFSSHLLLATEHPDFKKDDEKSTENVKRSTLPLAEREKGENLEIKWKDLENTEELRHGIITQSATSNLLNKPQSKMSEVALDIYGLPVTSEQKQTRTGEIDIPPAISPVKADPIYPVVSYEVSNAKGLTDIIEQNERPKVQTEKDSEFMHLNKQVTVPVITERESANKVNVYSTCGLVELIPETQVTLVMQKNTENFHTVLSNQNQKITEEHLENVTNRESETDQFASTSTCIQIAELKSSQVDSIKENVELGSSEKRRNTDLSRKRLKGKIPGSDEKNKFEVIKDNENIQEQNTEQNSTMIGVIKEDIKEEINDGLTESFTQKDIKTVQSQQHVLCDLSSQNTDHGLTTIEHPSPATEHVDNINADIQPKNQSKKKKKFGSTRRPYGKHQLTAEAEEEELKDMENIKENKHQIIPQATPLNLHTEKQITTSEVTPDIQNSSVTITKQQIITTEVETGTENDSSPRILSVESDQSRKVVLDTAINAEGLTKIMEQNEKAEMNEEKNDMPLHLNKLKMAPVITKTQDDTFKEHVKMPSDKSLNNECVNDFNIHSTYENVDNRNAEIHTQTQTKKGSKFGSTRRLQGRHETTAEIVEEEWKDLENTEKTHSIDESKFDMPFVLEQYHTKTEKLQENPKNTESKPDQCEITCPVVHIQELKIARGDLATKNLGDSTHGKRKKIGSTRKSLRVMKEKENIQEQTTKESTPNSETFGAEKETLNLSADISHQSKQMHFETLNIEDEDEKMRPTSLKQNEVEAWQKTTDFAGENNLECLQLIAKEDICNPESNFCPTTTSRQENEPHIHHKLDQSVDFLHNKIELQPNKSMVNTPAVNPDILEMPESISEGSLQHLSSQNSQTHIEPSSQARRRKMGSSRKMSKNKNANVTNDEPTIDARTVEDTVIAESTKEIEECVELSQINESSAQDTEQLSEGRQKFGSRCTTKESSGSVANKDGLDEYKREKDIQVTEGELKVSDTGYILEPKSTLISPEVSEPRTGTEEVKKSTEGSNVSLDSIRKTMSSAGSTGERQIIDYEQCVDTFVHTVTFGNRTVKLYVWDTAGQERYHSITRQVFHKAHGLLLMYDITSTQSFHAVRDWISQVQQNAAPDVILMLLGNKNDCAHREVLLQDGEHLSNNYVHASSTRLFSKLDGLFAVYKPQGVHWKHVRDTIETNLLKAVNSCPAAPPRTKVQFQLLPSGDSSSSSQLTVAKSNLPALSDHPLVTGPRFHKIRVGVGHRLDAFSSGVLDHVTNDKLERVLAMIQGANQKALITYSQVDLSTQEAYELAVKGLLRPQDKSPPILTGLRCLCFEPPKFTLEVQCVNETQRFLRKLVHEVGLELRTNAVCTKVRRTRDGPFKIEDALIRHYWTADDIIPAIANFRRTTRKIRKNDIHRQAAKPSNFTIETPSQTKTSSFQLESVGQEKDLLSPPSETPVDTRQF